MRRLLVVLLCSSLGWASSGLAQEGVTGTSGRIICTEQDNVPRITNCREIRFSDGTVVNVGGGIIEVQTGPGGAGAGDVGTVGSCTVGECGIEGGADIFPFVYEGTANAFETTLAVTDPTADRTITFPDATGEVSLLGQTISGAELDALGVEAELEAVLDIAELQGSLSNAQIDNDITLDSLIQITDRDITLLTSNCTDAQVVGGSTTGSVECQADDDVPESGDFDAALALEADGALSPQIVDPTHMANADHGDVAWIAGAAVVENVQCGSACVSDAEVVDTITASNYLPLAGGTMTGALTLDNLGIIFEASDTNPACTSGVYATYADLSEGKLKKCENGILNDIGAGAGGSDSTAIHDNVAGEIAIIADKATPVAADHLLIEDSADSDNKKDITIGSLETALELLLEIADLQGNITDAKVPNNITIDAAATLTDGDKGDFTCTTGTCVVDANAIALTTDTAGDYFSDVTANQGLLKTGTEGATVGLIACSAGQVLKNVGGTSWACSADDTGAGGSDGTAIHENENGEIAAITAKSQAAGADLLLIEDSAASNAKKRMTVAGLEFALEGVMELQDMQGTVTDAQVPDTITASNYLPLTGGTLTGQLITDNLGIRYDASDTNPTCSAGIHTIFADLSENKLKKCENGVLSDLSSCEAGGLADDTITAAMFADGDFGGFAVTSNLATIQSVQSGLAFPGAPGPGDVFVLTDALWTGLCNDTVDGATGTLAFCRWDGTDWVSIGSANVITNIKSDCSGDVSEGLICQDAETGFITIGNGNEAVPQNQTATPPGLDTQCIFNDAGAYGADDGCNFDKTTNTLAVGGLIIPCDPTITECLIGLVNETASLSEGPASTCNFGAVNGDLQLHCPTGGLKTVVATVAGDTPTNGQVPRWNTGGTITWETASDDTVAFTFNCSDANTTDGTTYMIARDSSDTACSSTESPSTLKTWVSLPWNATAHSLTCELGSGAPPGATETLTVTARFDGVDTNASVVISDTSTGPANDTTASTAYTAGDRITLSHITSVGAADVGVTNCVLIMKRS